MGDRAAAARATVPAPRTAVRAVGAVSSSCEGVLVACVFLT
jgi:hypothetical protein